MKIYKCPKCSTEFSLGTKFCQNCGCNLETEFIETPICPKCGKTFPTSTKFCAADGSKLVSSDKLIPRCVKCGREYPEETKFCPDDGGQVIPEALRENSSITNDTVKKIVKRFLQSDGKIAWGKIVLVIAIIAAVIDLYIILHYYDSNFFTMQRFLGGFANAFLAYLKKEAIGWSIFALILVGAAKLVKWTFCKIEDSNSSAGDTIARYGGGLAAIFLLLGLFANVILKIIN